VDLLCRGWGTCIGGAWAPMPQRAASSWVGGGVHPDTPRHDSSSDKTQLLEAQEVIVRHSDILEHHLRVAAQSEGSPGVRPRTQGL